MFPVLRPSPRPSPGLGPSPGRGDTTPPFVHLRDLQLSSDSLPGLDWAAGGGTGGAAYSPHHHHHHKVNSNEVLIKEKSADILKYCVIHNLIRLLPLRPICPSAPRHQQHWTLFNY